MNRKDADGDYDGCTPTACPTPHHSTPTAPMRTPVPHHSTPTEATKPPKGARRAE